METIGKRGETLAARYLERQGFKILDCNTRIGHKEVDLIALDQGTLVFVEVKTRVNDQYGTAEESLTRKKLRNIEVALEIFLQNNQQYKNFRIDAVTITTSLPGKAILKHYRNLSSSY